MRVRYGKNNKNQRNKCLATARIDDMIYFGISRCSNKDEFNRDRATQMAAGRMARLIELMPNPDYWETEPPKGLVPVEETISMWFDPDRMHGCIKVEDAREMIEFFRSFK